MIIKLEKSNNFEHKQSKVFVYIVLIRNLKEDVQRLQHDKDELSFKNENIHDEMTPRYFSFSFNLI
jgi:hypothetical protein